MQHNAIYMTQAGFQNLNTQLLTKCDELRELTANRIETQESLGKDCFNDPEMVVMIQQENNLKENVASLQNTIGRVQIIEICDSMRNTVQIRIGSIVELDIYNVSKDNEAVEIWEITGFNETNIEERKLSYNSPLAQSILSGRKGECFNEILIPPHIYDIKIREMYKSWDEAKQK